MTDSTRRRLGSGLLALALAAGLAALPASAASAGRPAGPATLTGFAALPAETFLPGSEPSGALLGTAPVNGITPPFADQPVQGFSGVLRNGDGTYDVLSDNGYGNKANSADFLLRIQRIAPDTRTGAVDVVGGIHLTDPKRYVPFPLTRPDRVLTGADFDVESIVRAGDGTYWIGDEFGPWLLHFDRGGRLLSAPVPLPDVRAPENAAGNPNLPSSKGFEGMALAPDKQKLYPLLEGTVAGDEAGVLRLNEFDLRAGRYTERRWKYRLDAPANAIGDAISIDNDRLLIIERDGGQGDTAFTKKLFIADKRDRDRDGYLDKTLAADLLNLADPKNLGGFGPVFRFPFQTIEDVVILDDRTVAVLNDNNFPFSTGRTAGKPDNNEYIEIRLPEKLRADRRVLP
ncbi:glycerophosphoryl diester phosphodiesterase [Virgisporangium aliadipatigenens]|uniref:Glycerophosphoryl diester phosphodiesterase n=1 Tax=Virgisporangium aliadipatigenens TaxID=741659 RepID=A0A8J4DPL2_9ACTN|nr:esterase-like activity of phytase family protein [Virgisporangium aliadipatigenens]GIJ44547.1 glycerophosphoryl diester phosphodiesterase [Virgisporangium aliadipatigenens]